jgi:hypothetical protein
MPFLEVGGFSGTLVILEHSAALYRYSPALEMHRIRDPRFDDFSTYLDLQTFITVFNETFEQALQSGMPVITMPYTPLMAKVLQTCLHKYYSGFLDHWLCVPFFHDDEDTAKITLARIETDSKTGKVFIFEINDNRLAAASQQERKEGRFNRIDQMETPDGEPVPV